eukprot:16101-Heterococcus_DN1.PRE.3
MPVTPAQPAVCAIQVKHHCTCNDSCAVWPGKGTLHVMSRSGESLVRSRATALNTALSAAMLHTNRSNYNSSSAYQSCTTQCSAAHAAAPSWTTTTFQRTTHSKDISVQQAHKQWHWHITSCLQQQLSPTLH